MLKEAADSIDVDGDLSVYVFDNCDHSSEGIAFAVDGIFVDGSFSYAGGFSAVDGFFVGDISGVSLNRMLNRMFSAVHGILLFVALVVFGFWEPDT